MRKQDYNLPIAELIIDCLIFQSDIHISLEVMLQIISDSCQLRVYKTRNITFINVMAAVC